MPCPTVSQLTGAAALFTANCFLLLQTFFSVFFHNLGDDLSLYNKYCDK